MRFEATYGRSLLGCLGALIALWSCGGQSTNGPSAGREGRAGTGGTMEAAGGAAAAGRGAAGATAAGGSVAAGRGGAGGAGATAGIGAAGSSAGLSGGGFGAGGGSMDPSLGFGCGAARCSPGQACIVCVSESGSPRICVPHPEDDPAGYAEATGDCRPTSVYDECDGPEDCEPRTFCVAREGPDAFMRCRATQAVNGSCCFSCGAPTNCTLCRTSDDCPDGQACVPVETGLMGCR